MMITVHRFSTLGLMMTREFIHFAVATFSFPIVQARLTIFKLWVSTLFPHIESCGVVIENVNSFKGTDYNCPVEEA